LGLGLSILGNDRELEWLQLLTGKPNDLKGQEADIARDAHGARTRMRVSAANVILNTTIYTRFAANAGIAS